MASVVTTNHSLVVTKLGIRRYDSSYKQTSTGASAVDKRLGRMQIDHLYYIASGVTIIDISNGRRKATVQYSI